MNHFWFNGQKVWQSKNQSRPTRHKHGYSPHVHHASMLSWKSLDIEMIGSYSDSKSSSGIGNNSRQKHLWVLNPSISGSGVHNTSLLNCDITFNFSSFSSSLWLRYSPFTLTTLWCSLRYYGGSNEAIIYPTKISLNLNHRYSCAYVNISMCRCMVKSSFLCVQSFLGQKRSKNISRKLDHPCGTKLAGSAQIITFLFSWHNCKMSWRVQTLICFLFHFFSLFLLLENQIQKILLHVILLLKYISTQTRIMLGYVLVVNICTMFW